MATLATASAPFRVGQKQIFLPTFQLALLRTPFLPPQYASFRVPLWFSKLDLRDYLYHAYNVRILSVRSYIQQQRLRQGLVDHRRSYNKRWYRPKSVKRMTVELERPFAWPDAPEDFSSWGKDSILQQREEQEDWQERTVASMKDTVGPAEGSRMRMREQAKALLDGVEKWRPRVEMDMSEPYNVGLGRLTKRQI